MLRWNFKSDTFHNNNLLSWHMTNSFDTFGTLIVQCARIFPNINSRLKNICKFTYPSIARDYRQIRHAWFKRNFAIAPHNFHLLCCALKYNPNSRRSDKTLRIFSVGIGMQDSWEIILKHAHIRIFTMYEYTSSVMANRI